MASKDSHSKKKGLIKQFCAITGADKEAAKKMLEMCNYNVEVAINMHVEADEAVSVPDSATNIPAVTTTSTSTEEDVRAPILPIKGVLVEPGYTGFRTRRRPTRSVFDGFRDFEAETRQQEQELWNTSSSATNQKRRTLEDLFRPPLEMMHRGTFDSARDLGQNTNRWLMVNIQNVQEFPCQVLNRDIWSNQAIKSIIKEHFVFWQVYHDSEEGERYMQFYKIVEWPYVAIIDPRTGENMVVWTKVDSISFCDLVSEFLTAHPSLDGSSTMSPLPLPSPKRQRLDSILDASEDSQLEAAIKASLMENIPVQPDSSSSGGTTTTVEKDRGQNAAHAVTESRSKRPQSATSSENTEDEVAEEEEDDDDVEELETFESDSENSQQVLKESCREPAEKEEAATTTTVGTDNIPKSITTNTSPDEVKNWEEHLGPTEDPKSRLVIRFPDGSKEQLNLPCTSKLMALIVYVQSKGFSEEKYELVTNFPRKQISMLNKESSLKDVGLFPQETIFVQLL